MDFIEVNVDPKELKFTQDSIAGYVRSPCGENIPLKENLKKLRSGQLHPDDLPSLEVFRDEDAVLWSNDNRRLWLYRKAGISQITVKLFSNPLSRAPPRSDRDRDLMSDPNFFPRVRDEVVIRNPNEVRFSKKAIGPYWIISSGGEKFALEESLEKLKRGELSPDDSPPLNVSRDEGGVLWANNNERLWLYRMAGISQITMRILNRPLNRARPRSDRDRALMSNPNFFPQVRDEVLNLNPNEVRFSEKSIAPYWTTSSGNNVALAENLKKLQNGQLHPHDFTHLDVSRDENGVLWANDNEGLWLFRKAGISPITVKVCRKPLSKPPPRTECDRALMSTPDFFPCIRGQSQEKASISTQPKANVSDVVGKVNPNAIRFSEKCIAPYWTIPSGKKFLLEENMEMLKSGRLSPDDFPRLSISRDEDGVLWSNDNEGLWLFRKAGISLIIVKVFRKPLSRAPPRSESDRALMSTLNFFPSIKGQSQEEASTSTQPKPDNSHEVDKVNPNGIRFSEKSIAPYLTIDSGVNVPLEKILMILKSRQLSPDDLPLLEVSRDEDGVLWANDNETLWLFRKAGISSITVKVYRKPLSRAPPRSECDRALMKTPDFFPSMRGQSEETGSTWSNLKAEDIVGLVVGGALTATALVMGFSGWKLSALVGYAGWNLYKKLRE